MYQSLRLLPAQASLYKSLTVIYVLLLGFVLPFICWGRLATPGHPHQMAHLVFMMPPMQVESPRGEAHGEQADHHQAMNHEREQPVGRSVPAQLTSAISIISPLLLAQILLNFRPALFFLHLMQPTTSHLIDPRVLTPPPRPL